MTRIFTLRKDRMGRRQDEDHAGDVGSRVHLSIMKGALEHIAKIPWHDAAAFFRDRGNNR